MMSSWSARLAATPQQLKVLVTSPECGDLLKARLPLSPQHPRALLTLLEGVALWKGSALSAAISVAETLPSSLDSRLFGDGLWPAESPLVQFDVVAPGRRRRLVGLGDFRMLRRLPTGRQLG